MDPPKRQSAAQTYLKTVFIPSAVLVTGAALLKPDWTPYAVAVSAMLVGLTVFQNMPRKVLKPKENQSFKLKEKIVLSHNTAIYRFGLPRPNDILGLPIGQHISITADIKGTPVMRSYTPISSDTVPGHFDLLIKSYPTGNISKLVGELKIGDSIQVKGPKGAMVYTPNMVRHFGMIAGGTGITPMLQIIKAVLAGRIAGDETEIDLIFANVNEEDILLRKTLDNLASRDEKFRVHYVLNNPPEGWTGGVGFVTAEMIKKHLPPPAKDMKLLVCGPPPMVAAMRAATVSVGYEKPPKAYGKLEDQCFYF